MRKTNKIAEIFLINSLKCVQCILSLKLKWPQAAQLGIHKKDLENCSHSHYWRGRKKENTGNPALEGFKLMTFYPTPKQQPLFHTLYYFIMPVIITLGHF